MVRSAGCEPLRLLAQAITFLVSCARLYKLFRHPPSAASSENWMPLTPCFPGWAGPFCWRCRSLRHWLCLFRREPLAVNPWIKPIKFSMSFSTFASTVSLLLLALRIPKWQLTLARRAIAVSVALEILSLAAQAWRSAYHLSGQSLLDTSLAQMTNSMVMVNTGIVCWMLALFCVNRVRTDQIDRPMVAAIRYSIVIFLAGNAIGGYMLARGSHTVGVADGGPGLPFVNWSVIGGDLRIAHFIAIHAIQIVPLFAYILSQMAPILPVKHRRIAAGALALAVSIAVGATFVQAALGHPLLSLR